MQLRRGLSNTLLAGALGLAGAFFVFPARPQAEQSADDLLGKVFEEVERNQLDLALKHVEALLQAKPNFRLAYLIKGDLLLARGRALKTFGDAPPGSSERLPGVRPEGPGALHGY